MDRRYKHGQHVTRLDEWDRKQPPNGEGQVYGNRLCNKHVARPTGGGRGEERGLWLGGWGQRKGQARGKVVGKEVVGGAYGKGSQGV